MERVSGASLLARDLFTWGLQVTSLPCINMQQRLCCWGAAPLRTICPEVFVRMETHLNEAGIECSRAPGYTECCIWAAPHKPTQQQQQRTRSCGHHAGARGCIQNGSSASLSSWAVWRLSSMNVRLFILIALLKHKYYFGQLWNVFKRNPWGLGGRICKEIKSYIPQLKGSKGKVGMSFLSLSASQGTPLAVTDTKISILHKVHHWDSENNFLIE